MALNHEDICKLVEDARQTEDGRRRNLAYESLHKLTSATTYFTIQRFRHLDKDEATSESHLVLLEAVAKYDLIHVFTSYYAMILKNRLLSLHVRNRTTKSGADVHHESMDADYEMGHDGQGMRIKDILTDPKSDATYRADLRDEIESLNIHATRLEWNAYKETTLKGATYETAAKELKLKPKQIDNAIMRFKRQVNRQELPIEEI